MKTKKITYDLYLNDKMIVLSQIKLIKNKGSYQASGVINPQPNPELRLLLNVILKEEFSRN